MQGETKERWRELCERIVHEQDPVRFDATILELLEVLERDDQRRHNAGLGVPLTEKPWQVKFSGALGVETALDIGGIAGLHFSAGPYIEAVRAAIRPSNSATALNPSLINGCQVSAFCPIDRGESKSESLALWLG